MTLYTEQIKRAVRQIDKPPGFVCDFIDKGDHMTLRVYEDDIYNLDFRGRLAAMEYLTTVQKVIMSYGVQCYAEGAEGGRPVLRSR